MVVNTEELDALATEWANNGELEEYIGNQYDLWAIWLGGENAEVFVEDSELIDIDGGTFDDTFFTYDALLQKHGHDLEGEEITGVMEEYAVEICKMSEMVPIEQAEFEYNDKGEILYWAFSKNFKKIVNKVLDMQNS